MDQFKTLQKAMLYEFSTYRKFHLVEIGRIYPL